MRVFIVITFLLISNSLIAQQKIVRTIESDATEVYVSLDGIDNLIIEESSTDSIEMTLLDMNELGVLEAFTCEDKACRLEVKAIVKQQAINDKIHQFPLAPPTNITAVLKIPKNKNLTIEGIMIDIQSKGYKGILKLYIDKGNIRLPNIKGIVDIEMFSGTIFANIAKKTTIDIQTRKGRISLDKKPIKSPYKKNLGQEKQLIIRSINANVVLTSQKTT